MKSECQLRSCILITSPSKQFLENYFSSPDKQAFLDVYHMLSLLDKYLYDHPKQHTHCMSSDNEYVSLLQHTVSLHIDLTMFPTLWAVLSILLDTQDCKCKCVKCLQEEYNNYCEDKSTEHMLKLKRWSRELQSCMYDSITHNFDGISGLHDNSMIPSQMQDRYQIVKSIASENAVDYNVTDIDNIPSMVDSHR